MTSNLSPLFQTLNLDPPCLPSKPWESISSESGTPNNPPNDSNTLPPFYPPSTISEENLVKLVIHALHGVESTLKIIEKVSEDFCNEAADRSKYRNSGLWNRSSSSHSLGKILKSIGRSGYTVFLVRKFIEHFLCRKIGIEDEGRSRSLINQAFVVAIGKVLEGYVSGIDTLCSSVELRRSSKKMEDSGDGCLRSVANSDITIMEVYLHTKELRNHIKVLGNICLFKNVDLAFLTLSTIEDLTKEVIKGFCNFPIGANLLTYLYNRLRDADPVHHALLKYLFLRACEPYFGFIKSWIYEARIDDPYHEFIVEHINDLPPISHGGDGYSIEMSLPSIKAQDGITVPCFLKDFCVPLFRAGQQLQVLIKLLELCHCVYPGDQTYESILPHRAGSSCGHISSKSPLTFSKRTLEEVVYKRECMYQRMHENLEVFLTRLDFRYQKIRDNAMSFSVATLVERINSASSADKGESNSEDCNHDLDTSSAIDEIYSEGDVDSFESECSYSCSSKEREESARPIEAQHDLFETEIRYPPASQILRNIFNENLQTPSRIEKINEPTYAPGNSIKEADSISHYSGAHIKTESNYISESFHSGDIPWSKLPESLFSDYQPLDHWPVGGLLENRFIVDGNRADKKMYFTDALGRNNNFGKVETLGTGKEFPLDTPITLGGQNDTKSESGTNASTWNHKYTSNFFSLNPMLTKHDMFHMMGKSRGTSVPFFDFSSVKNPSEVNCEKLLASPDNVFEFGLPSLRNSSVSDEECVDVSFLKQRHVASDMPSDNINLSFVDSDNQLRESFVPDSLSGGKWATSLSKLGKSAIYISRARTQSKGTMFDVPLDVVIDKCILQEILLQYNYISHFTIKLLEGGFDLQEHLLALRRYHFMESADWADLFIMSLWRHRWNGLEANQRISEIQRILDVAVQRSSCETDPYKERLVVYAKDHEIAPLSLSASGVHAFDFIALGYRVDWPVNIVLTSDALKMYADIFSFLIQVKLAVFSLTDIWCSLKDILHQLGRNHNSVLVAQEKNHFNNLIKMRHQMNHFVSTLQQYVQSQLSHVSWCRFLHSLKHKVKDILDIDSVHMAYLADSLDICFLSDETRPVADNIDTILQCALDFGSCLRGVDLEVGSGKQDTLHLLSQINFSQVSTIRKTFEKNIKDLYICYLKSPKHDEFGICHFWGNLNYNDYYLNVIGDCAI